MKRLIVFFLPLLTLGASNCSGVRVRPDSTPVQAAEANDKTVIIEGCGSQPVVGYTYCRVREGSPITQTITFVSPPTKCKTEPCITYTVFFPNGEPSKSISVLKDETRTTVNFAELVKRQTFEKNDRGFWPVVMTMRWLDLAGNEFESHVEGEIRLRVLASGYVPLNESEADPDLVWKWTDSGMRFGFSTAGRAHAGKVGK